jgi:hypothetical protein
VLSGLTGHPTPQSGGGSRLGLRSRAPLGKLHHTGFNKVEPLEEARHLGVVAEHERRVDRPFVECPRELFQLRVDVRGEVADRQVTPTRDGPYQPADQAIRVVLIPDAVQDAAILSASKLSVPPRK